MAIAVGASSAEAACVRPDPVALHDGQMMVGGYEMRTTPIESPGERLRWVATSWGGPINGSIFVVDCKGAKRATLPGLGYVEKLMSGPKLEGRPSLIVEFQPDSGTNIKDVNVAILQYIDGSIVKYWEHNRFNGAYPPKSLGPQEETIYRWRFTGGARRIEVTGRYITYRYPKTNRPLRSSDINHVRPLDPERFCLNGHAKKYLPCR